MTLQNLTPTVYWLTDHEIKNIYTSELWNDIEQEKKTKSHWWIIDNNFNKLWDYLKSSKLYYDYIAGEKKLKKFINANATVVDLAAGIGWTSALLSKLDEVKEVNCVEISKHRLELICPKAIEMFEGKPEKIKRYVGSFYSTKFKDESADVVFMSQAFHHADKPFELLQETHRILKKRGIVIIIGEPYKNLFKIFKRFIYFLIKHRKISLNFRELFPVHPVQGDHIYRVSDYFFISESVGFSCKTEPLPSGDRMYILEKK